MNIALLVDIGVVAILIISAGVSFFRGFIREALTILGVLGGGFAALSFGASVVPLTSKWFGIKEGEDPEKLFDLIPMDMAAQVAAYAGIFLLVFIILQLASHLISSAAQAMGLGPVDRTLGIFFGLARGLLLLGVLYLPFHLILHEDNKKEWFGDSKTMVFVQGTTEWLTSFMPNKTSGEVVEETRDKLNKIDILGDKRVAPEETAQDAKTQDPASQEETPTHYSDKARQGLENLIENKIDETTRKNLND